MLVIFFFNLLYKVNLSQATLIRPDNSSVHHTLDVIAPLVAKPPPVNSTTDTDTHLLGYSDHMVHSALSQQDLWL